MCVCYRFYWVLFIISFLLTVNVPIHYWDESVLNAFFVIGAARFVITTNIVWLVNSALLIWGLKKGDRLDILFHSFFFSTYQTVTRFLIVSWSLSYAKKQSSISCLTMKTNRFLDTFIFQISGQWQLSILSFEIVLAQLSLFSTTRLESWRTRHVREGICHVHRQDVPGTRMHWANEDEQQWRCERDSAKSCERWKNAERGSRGIESKGRASRAQREAHISSLTKH